MQWWNVQYQHSRYHVSHGFGTMFCRRQEKDVFLYSGPGLTVSSQSLIQQLRPGILWGVLAVPCSYIWFSNRLLKFWGISALSVWVPQVSYNPFLTQESKGFMPAACPVKNPLHPALLLTSSGFHSALCLPVLEGCSRVTAPTNRITHPEGE